MSEDKSFKKVGKYLRQRRVDIAFTQQEVASFLDYTTSQFISNWERGEALPPKSCLKKLVKLYSLDSKEFVNIMLEHHKIELNKALNISTKE